MNKKIDSLAELVTDGLDAIGDLDTHGLTKLADDAADMVYKGAVAVAHEAGTDIDAEEHDRVFADIFADAEKHMLGRKN